MNESQATPPPPPITQRFVRYVLGFGISVAVGLAPFLGKVKVPLFEPLLNILPPTEQSVAIPISATLMGIIAVAVQWYAYEHLPRNRLRRIFARTLVLAVVALLAFYIVNMMVVSRVSVGDDSTAVLIHGYGAAACQECAGKSDVECLRHITFDPGRVEACWGSPQLRLARMSLTLTYFAATGMFAAIVGLLVLGTPKRA
jgi:hypothetical protein